MQNQKCILKTRVYTYALAAMYSGLPCVEVVHDVLKQGIAVWCGTAFKANGCRRRLCLVFDVNKAGAE